MLKKDNLHYYQIVAKDHIKTNEKAGAFLDMGLGKTIITLTAIQELIYEELEIDNCLVIAPKRVAEHVWTSEIKRWNHLNNLSITRIIGTEKQRLLALEQESDIHIIGRDNVTWLCGQYGGSMLPYDMLIIDESSSFKNRKSLRFKALKKVRQSFERIVLLTGTPAPNGLIDLWSQMFILDGGERLGKFIDRYKWDYFKPGKRNGAIIYSYNLRKDSENIIFDRISDICISMKAKDYLKNLPGRKNNFIEVQLPKKVMHKYEEFEREQVLQLFEDTNYEKDIFALNAAALSNKLLQFSNGAIYDENRDWHEIHNHKIQALEEIIENANGKPILVAYSFRHDLYRIESKFAKLNPRRLKTDQDIDDWNDGKIQLLVMHPASGGHGLNLQFGGNIIVWFGQTWNLELYLQLNARLDRQGKLDETIIHHIVCKNTIDIDVSKAIKNKDKTQNSLMNAVKAIIKKYT